MHAFAGRELILTRVDKCDNRDAARRGRQGQNSWLVGLNRISLMSTSSGWLMANTTALAKESAGIAFS